jgi:hypothetical protein
MWHSASIFPQQDMEVLMKTNLNTIFFLHNEHHRKATHLSTHLTVNKTRHDKSMTILSRQLIYESTADDIFWVLQPKLQGNKQFEKLCRSISD